MQQQKVIIIGRLLLPDFILLVYYQIWTAISRTFSLDDDKTKDVIKNWVKDHFKLTGINPQIKLAPWKSE